MPQPSTPTSYLQHIPALDRTITVKLLNPNLAGDLWLRWGRCAAESRGGTEYERIAKTCLARQELSQSRMCYFDFHVSGVSRVCTHQLVRHHEGVVVGQASMRGQNDTSDLARYRLPMGTPTSLMVSMNVEALINFCHQRLCTRASKEIQAVAHALKSLATYAVPELTPHLVPACKWLAECPYGGCDA